MAEEKTLRLGVLVSGRGSNLQAIIDSVEDGGLPAKIAVAISNKAGAPALERCRKHGVEAVFLDPKAYPDKGRYDRALIDLLDAKSADLVCLAGYMRVLGKEFIQAFRGRIVNIHPSLLPAFPGLNAQQQALDHGVRVSGCTVHFVEEEVDGGPIILQSAVPVYPADDAETLSQRILEQEHRIYPEARRRIAENRLTLSGRRVIIRND